MNPVISIITPCYNQAEYLSETLESVLNQEYQKWECIIVNDGSTDNSEQVALEWTKKDNRFKYIYKPNTGVSDSRNFAINQALGTYILPLDGDDKISPTYIKEALEMFETKPDTKLVYSNKILFGAQNIKKQSTPYSYKQLFFENLIFCSAIFRKSDFLETNGYNPNMKEGLEDWDFWLSFLNKEDIVVKLDGFHFYYRIKDVSRSTLIDNEKNERLLLQMFRNHLPKFLEHFNPFRDHINADFYKRESAWLKDQPEYKIGTFIYEPIRFLRRIFRKKNN